MYYRNDNQSINKDDVESPNKNFDENFYNESYNYPYMNFSPMMYDPLICAPQAMPTNVEYDNDDYNAEFDDYELARSPHAHHDHNPHRRHHIHHHIHHHFFHPFMWPWWINR
ncbi:hypothetical protein C3B64_14720 [Clostridium botulinum]|uniref:Spore coat protein n=1 Tax=Clostridium botulinum TaxID=1491 RepID=A0AAU8YY31_CLOBO|nr:hypothetical protein [Clostridium sporogenes]AVP65431.1 hypothetical protein C3B64_14720 [Clostridium botulinum]MCF4016019.1 hypothetical protein [Clostridium sporogenes]